MRSLVSLALLVVVAVGMAACSLSKSSAREEPKEVAPTTAPINAWMFERPRSPLRESGGIAIAKAPTSGRTLAFLADEGDRAIVVVDGESLAPVARTDLEGTPGAVIVLPTGEIAVALVDRDLVVVFGAVGEGEKLELLETRRVRTGSEPRNMALTPDDRTLLVTTGGSHRVEAFDVAKLDAQWSKDVAREPRAIAVTANGKTALVSFATSSEIALVPLDEPTKPAKMEEKTTLSLGLPAAIPSCTYGDASRTARHANAFVRRSHEEREVFWVPVAQSAPRGGWEHGYGAMLPSTPIIALPVRNRFGLAAFDVRTIFEEPALKTDVKSFEENHYLIEDCLLPRAAISSKNGALVACEGQSDVVEVEKRNHWPTIRARFKVGRGPSAIAALDDEHAIVWSRFDRSLARLVTSTKEKKNEAERAETLKRLRPFEPLVARGEEIFRRTGDPRIAKSGVACANCHPDGRDDGIVWMASGNERRTLLLAGNIAERPTYGWSGEHASLTTRIGATIRRLQGTGLPPDEVEALAAYLLSMKAPPASRTKPADGAEARGAELFRSSRAGCTSCHAGDRASDRQLHDVGSGGTFLTPSLVGVGARRALFHDGRYADFETMLEKTRGMGGGAELEPNERADLAAFLRTL